MKKSEGRNRLNIAVIEPIGGHGGNEFYDFGLCEALSLSHKVTLFTCDKTRLHLQFPFKTEVKTVYKGIYGNSPSIVKGLRYLRGTLSALFYCLKKKVDLVHLHIYRFAFWEKFNLLLFRFFRFKVVATVHDIEPFARFGEKVNINYDDFLKHSDAIIVHTDFSAQCLNRLLNEKNSKKIRKVKSGDIDFVYKKEIVKEEARKKLNLPLDKKIIMFFGQIKKVKGLDVLIRAFNIVGKNFQDANLLIAGKPWKVDLNEYLNLIDKELKDRVISRANFIPNEEVPFYFAASDIVVLPYRKIYNSSVILRAFDYGSAVIASNLDTFKEFIDSGKNGLLFKSEDFKDLAEKIEYLLLNPEKIKVFKKNAERFVAENYNRKEINLQMNKIFSEIFKRDFQ